MERGSINKDTWNLDLDLIQREKRLDTKHEIKLESGGITESVSTNSTNRLNPSIGEPTKL